MEDICFNEDGLPYFLKSSCPSSLYLLKKTTRERQMCTSCGNFFYSLPEHSRKCKYRKGKLLTSNENKLNDIKKYQEDTLENNNINPDSKIQKEIIVTKENDYDDSDKPIAPRMQKKKITHKEQYYNKLLDPIKKIYDFIKRNKISIKKTITVYKEFIDLIVNDKNKKSKLSPNVFYNHEKLQCSQFREFRKKFMVYSSTKNEDLKSLKNDYNITKEINKSKLLFNFILQLYQEHRKTKVKNKGKLCLFCNKRYYPLIQHLFWKNPCQEFVNKLLLQDDYYIRTMIIRTQILYVCKHFIFEEDEYMKIQDKLIKYEDKEQKLKKEPNEDKEYLEWYLYYLGDYLLSNFKLYKFIYE